MAFCQILIWRQELVQNRASLLSIGVGMALSPLVIEYL